MLEKNKIVDLLCEELSYAYCNNCRYVMGEDDACGNCHRKYSGWSLSEDTANYLANAIVAQGKVVEWQNDSPDIQPKTGRWIPIKPLLTAARCSECKRAFTDRTIFCPNCGAKMEDTENERKRDFV